VHEGRVINVIIDRMLLDEHGQRWIVDLKTSTHEGGGEREFIEREAERYRPQLQRYAALASRLGSEPVRLALYFPLLGVFRELDTAAT
jgi:ATP-dependent exoDNAse (exonuclease V) beta subunit